MINIKQPRYPLLNLPTPLQRIERTEKKLGFSGLYVKRDDQMLVAMGGNKLRSLEFWLGEAIQEAAGVLLVAGAPISNQCRLTAAAASMAGLECIILHNADEDETSRKQSFLNNLLGAETRYIGPVDEDTRTLKVTDVATELRQQGRVPYIVGNPAVGALGYVVAAQELYEQSQETGANIRHVILSGSMGPTEAGFIFGNTLLGNPFDVHLISVEYQKEELTTRIDKIVKDISALTGLCPEGYDPSRLHIHMDYLGEGYNQSTIACEQAIIDFARTEAIFLEHTYTGKTFAGFLDLIRRDAFPKGDGICAIHTGGVPSLFSQFDMFKTL